MMVIERSEGLPGGPMPAQLHNAILEKSAGAVNTPLLATYGNKSGGLHLFQKGAAEPALRWTVDGKIP